MTKQEAKENKKLVGEVIRYKRGGSDRFLEVTDYMTMGEVTEIVEKAKELARAGDVKTIIFLMEQLFGKARQVIGLEGNSEKPIVFIDSALAKKHGINQTQQAL